MSKKIFIALVFIFAFLSFVAFKDALPEAKNKEVMNAIAPYFPYKLEKTLKGLKIVNVKTGESEEPSNSVVFKRLDEIEKKWGKQHLRLNGKVLIIMDDNKKVIKKIKLNDKKAIQFAHKFFKL